MKKAVVLAIVIWVASSAASLGTPHTPTVSSQDIGVLTAVLSHFAKSKHSAQYNPNGYIGVAPITSTLSNTWTDEDYLKYQPKLKPSAPRLAVLSWVHRNQQTYRLEKFPLAGPAVHVDSTKRELGLLPLDPKGELRTYAYLRVPGYSNDGAWAYVSFEYLWSMHPAFATYLLKRVDGNWVIIATDFSYAV
jgi:hypothetical protein